MIRLQTEFAGAWQGLLVIHKRRGDLAAIPLFRKAAALDPNYSEAYCDLAGALATLGQTREALAILGQYRERHPKDRVAADLERAIRAEASLQLTISQLFTFPCGLPAGGIASTRHRGVLVSPSQPSSDGPGQSEEPNRRSFNEDSSAL